MTCLNAPSLKFVSHLYSSYQVSIGEDPRSYLNVLVQDSRLPSCGSQDFIRSENRAVLGNFSVELTDSHGIGGQEVERRTVNENDDKKKIGHNAKKTEKSRSMDSGHTYADYVDLQESLVSVAGDPRSSIPATLPFPTVSDPDLHSIPTSTSNPVTATISSTIEASRVHSPLSTVCFSEGPDRIMCTREIVICTCPKIFTDFTGIGDLMCNIPHSDARMEISHSLMISGFGPRSAMNKVDNSAENSVFNEIIESALSEKGREYGEGTHGAAAKLVVKEERINLQVTKSGSRCLKILAESNGYSL